MLVFLKVKQNKPKNLKKKNTHKNVKKTQKKKSNKNE